MRSLHSFSGIIAAFFISLIATTGAYLSINPLIDNLSVATTPEVSVAEIASIADQKVSGIERIERKASGAVLIHSSTQDGMVTSVLDPQTGELTLNAAPSELKSIATELHRSLFLSDIGRGISGLSAVFLLLISYSGLLMLAKRMGGWSKVFNRAEGKKAQRLHIDIARIAIIGFTVSAFTGLYMSLVTFGVVTEGATEPLPFPENVAQGSVMALEDIQALSNISLSNLRELTFPYPDDPSDVFTIKTDAGEGFIEQVSGELIAFQTNGFGGQVYETMYILHTGQGGGFANAILAILLGVSALTIPVLSFTGIIIWWKRFRNTPRIKSNASLKSADTIILVGSEGNSTWGFASTLHKGLVEQGIHVRVDAMNAFSSQHLNAKHILILASTYGDGVAPSSADQFIEKVKKTNFSSATQFAVLGFGDKQFPHYCAFANVVENQLRLNQCELFHPLTKINQQSPQAFKDWGNHIGEKLAISLALEHVPEAPKTRKIFLSKVVAKSNESGSQTAILRFELPQSGQRKTFQAGDLIAIIPLGSLVPRYYSIASSSGDGFVEICVKQHKFGLCSNYLLNLNEGDEIEYFIKQNPQFKLNQKSTPIVMIGAGTGIAPLAGFARENKTQRPIYLFWGGRNPYADFIYRDTLANFIHNRKLSKAFFAFSRVSNRLYVQDKLKKEADLLRSLVSQGAQIMVCGGPEMANSVKATINEILSPQGIGVNSLQKEQRYLEDVY